MYCIVEPVSGGKVRPLQIEKKQVRLHFRRAAKTYDRQAVVQHRVADRLLELILRHINTLPDTVFEIGCCTGILTRKLVSTFPGIRNLHLNDLVPRFSEYADRIDLSGSLHFLAGDIEELELRHQYQLIISSSTFHWLHDLSRLFAKLELHLQPGGVLAFALYGPKNLCEVRSLTGRGLDYLTLDQVRTLLAQHFDVLEWLETQEILVFPDPGAVLQHLRETGVNALTEAVWTKSVWRDFIGGYWERFREPEGVRLSYHPMYFIARTKKAGDEAR